MLSQSKSHTRHKQELLKQECKVLFFGAGSIWGAGSVEGKETGTGREKGQRRGNHVY